RRRRPRPLRTSEPEADREKIVQAAEIDLRRGKIFGRGQRSLAPRVAKLPADADRSDRERAAAEYDGPDFCARSHEAVAEDAVVARIDEVAGLAVPPILDGHSPADVRPHRTAMAERQHPHRRGKRDDPQLELLLDFAAV